MYNYLLGGCWLQERARLASELSSHISTTTAGPAATESAHGISVRRVGVCVAPWMRGRRQPQMVNVNLLGTQRPMGCDATAMRPCDTWCRAQAAPSLRFIPSTVHLHPHLTHSPPLAPALARAPASAAASGPDCGGRADRPAEAQRAEGAAVAPGRNGLPVLVSADAIAGVPHHLCFLPLHARRRRNHARLPGAVPAGPRAAPAAEKRTGAVPTATAAAATATATEPVGACSGLTSERWRPCRKWRNFSYRN